MRRVIATAAFAFYAGMIVLSNFLLQHFGLIHVGFGLLAPAGTFCAALTFPARDVVQRFGGFAFGAVAVLVGAGISWWISPTLAAASALAYLCSESTDLVVFTALRGRFILAVLASGLVASLVDSIVFLHLAHIPWSAAGPGLLYVKWLMQAASCPLTVLLRRALPTRRVVTA